MGEISSTLGPLVSLPDEAATGQRGFTVRATAGILSDMLQRIKHVAGSQSGTSPGTYPLATQLSPHTTGQLDSTGTHQIPTPPTYPSLGRARPHSAVAGGSPGFGSLPQFASSSQTFSTSPLASASSMPYPPGMRRTSLPGGSANRASALDALAHLASSASPDVHRFASHMRQPIQALQDAVEQLNEGENSADEGALDAEQDGAAGATATATAAEDLRDRKPDVGPGVASTASASQSRGLSAPNSYHSNGADQDRRDERPSKRARVARPVVATPDQFDLVAKGLISDTEARALVLL